MKKRNGSHVFASSLMASNKKHANLTWLSLEIMQRSRAYMTCLSVTLSVLDMIIV